MDMKNKCNKVSTNVYRTLKGILFFIFLVSSLTYSPNIMATDSVSNRNIH